MGQLINRTSATTNIKDAWGSEHGYVLTLLPGSKSIRFQARLADILGGPLQKGLAGLKMGGDIELAGVVDIIPGGNIGEAVATMVKNIKDADPIALARDIFCETKRDGILLDERGMDSAYRANTVEFWRAMAWAIQENYGDFFDLLRDLKGPEETPAQP